VFGQTKLPGNRERVISSGDLQFFDRSIMNSRFNIDRDFGFFVHYTMKHLILRGAVTSGEGRNSELSNDGLATTGRIELLPFGPFASGNDYVEGDLAREKSLKVSIGTTYSQNAKALRQAGQLGNDLYESRTLNSLEVDMFAKLNGWALLTEYMNRSTTNPVTVSEADPTKTRTVYEGYGMNGQLSYLFKNNFEIATRYAKVVPSSSLYDNDDYPSLLENQFENYELGVTKYLNGHRFKIQGGLLHTRITNLRANSFHDSYWSAVFQVEIGI
jgi:phosphate-selective porin OprO/OprP